MLTTIGQHAMLPLRDFIEKLQAEYYESITRLCADVSDQVNKIHGLDPASMDDTSIKRCQSVLNHIVTPLDTRRARLVPYLKSLADKVSGDHNCANCAGGCKINHEMHLFELTESTKSMKQAHNELQLLSLPLYHETNFPDQYRVLRSLIALVESDMIELFFLEENYLIPKIIDAQRAINVSGR